MRFFTARSLALATLVPALLLFVFVPGCAKQSEGERCGDDSGSENNEDCGDGLTCTSYSLLLNGENDKAHRCCYTDGSISDSRCERRAAGGVPIAGAGGGGGVSVAGASGAGASAGGMSAGGMSAGGDTGGALANAGAGGEGG